MEIEINISDNKIAMKDKNCSFNFYERTKINKNELYSAIEKMLTMYNTKFKGD